MEGTRGGVSELGGVEGLEAVVSHLDVEIDACRLSFSLVSLSFRSLWSCVFLPADEPQLRVSGVCVQQAKSENEINLRGCVKLRGASP